MNTVYYKKFNRGASIMGYSIPFIADELSNLLSGSITIVQNDIYSTNSLLVDSLILGDKQTFTGTKSGTWRVENGQIIFATDKHDEYIFNGLETNNNSMYYIGTSPLVDVAKTKTRFLMYKNKALGDNFSICISTCEKYLETTLPRLLKSLRRVNFPETRISVVVGNCKEELAKGVDGIKYFYTKEDLKEFNGLIGADPNMHCLLLHDTCEVGANFYDVMKNVNVGINYDFISCFEQNYIGLYSPDYLAQRRSLNALTSKTVLPFKFWLDLSKDVIKIVDKDVYGLGNKRQVVYNNVFGISKYIANRPDKL